MRRRTWAVVFFGIALLIVGVLIARNMPTPNTNGLNGNAESAKAQLAELAVGTWHPMQGYSRDHFKHWILQSGHCDTREMVLERDGRNVTTTSDCHVTSGSWTSPYDDKAITNATQMDIDHLVPLANAWRTGADQWTDQQRERFANDLTVPQLLAVSLGSNRAKGDQDPSQWRPGDQSFWCAYAIDWITVKHAYRLFVTAAEKGALQDMLARC